MHNIKIEEIDPILIEAEIGFWAKTPKGRKYHFFLFDENEQNCLCLSAVKRNLRPTAPRPPDNEIAKSCKARFDRRIEKIRSERVGAIRHILRELGTKFIDSVKESVGISVLLLDTERINALVGAIHREEDHLFVQRIRYAGYGEALDKIADMIGAKEDPEYFINSLDNLKAIEEALNKWDSRSNNGYDIVIDKIKEILERARKCKADEKLEKKSNSDNGIVLALLLFWFIFLPLFTFFLI